MILTFFIKQEELDRSQHELEIKSLSVDAMTRNFDGQSAAQQNLEAVRSGLEEKVNELRLKVTQSLVCEIPGFFYWSSNNTFFILFKENIKYLLKLNQSSLMNVI